MQKRQFSIIGNWKSNKTTAEAVQWMQDFNTLWHKNPPKIDQINIVLCPSFIHLTQLASLIEVYQVPLSLGSQDISDHDSGAYTGQVSGRMLVNLVRYSLVGHSERRANYHEDDAILTKKMELAQAQGIIPIYCVQTPDAVIPKNCQYVAYEPVWAIGTGKAETAENANLVAKQLKERGAVNVIYGGSVKAENVATYKASEYIDGVLPGGASLNPGTFLELITHASTT